MHEIKEGEGNIVIVTVSGALTREDYDELIPSWNAAIPKTISAKENRVSLPNRIYHLNHRLYVNR